MPTKNRLNLLIKAINSVKNQNFDNWELIVVNDGSTDGTKAYLETLAEVDIRIRVLSNPTSQGGPMARNAAIRIARGDFVTGLDDDDSFTPDRLQSFADAWLEYIKKGITPSALYSNQNIYQHGSLITITQKPTLANYDDLFSQNYIGNQIFAPRMNFISAGLFRPELPAWQDLEFFLRIVKNFGLAYLVPHATYNFDESPRSDRISLKNEEKMRSAFEIVNSFHSNGELRKTQRLLLQLLGRYYRLSPRLADYKLFFFPEPWPIGVVKLIIKSFQTSLLYERGSKMKKFIKSHIL